MLSPFAEFLANQSASAVLLLAATLLAVVLANTPVSDDVRNVFTTHLSLVLQEHIRLSMTLHEWISSGLMTFFFFLLGLEIKRELIAGELRDVRKSLPVLAAAVGGMLVPALFYLAVVQGERSSGWAVPMATDAAFAIGILSLLGGRVPAPLLVFVTALAIIDDLGAVLVIAVFYSGVLDWFQLGIVTVLLASLWAFTAAGGRSGWVYLMVGAVMWYLLHHAGVHATVAGVLVAAVAPARPFVPGRRMEQRLRGLLARHKNRRLAPDTEGVLEDPDRHQVVERIVQTAQLATTPLQRWEHGLEKPVLLVVMPLFALANAGISLSPEKLSQAASSVSAWGVAAGLLLGKLCGILGFTWFAVKLGMGDLPDRCTYRHIVGVGLLAGIGFTMSIFIATLAYGSGTAAYESTLTAVLASSLVAGLSGYTWIRFFT